MLGQWTLQWTEDGHAQQRVVELRVTATSQPFGGVRRWWRCPVCHRRCRLLLAADPRALIGFADVSRLDTPATRRRPLFLLQAARQALAVGERVVELGATISRRSAPFAATDRTVGGSPAQSFSRSSSNGHLTESAKTA